MAGEQLQVVASVQVKNGRDTDDRTAHHPGRHARVAHKRGPVQLYAGIAVTVGIRGVHEIAPDPIIASRGAGEPVRVYPRAIRFAD